jgi:hypothetical protein
MRVPVLIVTLNFLTLRVFRNAAEFNSARDEKPKKIEQELTKIGNA